MKQAVFYLKENWIVVQNEKEVLRKIDLADFIKDRVIEDKEAFSLYLIDELQNIVKKVEAGIVILGSGLLFQRAYDKDEKLNSVKKELLESVTFPKDLIQEKVIETPLKNYLLITDKGFYSAVVNALKELEIEVIAVLPLSLFSDSPDDELNKDEIKTILEKESLYASGDFLTKSEDKEEMEGKVGKLEEKEDDKEKEAVTPAKDEPKSLPFETVSVWRTGRLLLVLGFLVVLTVLLGGLIYLQQNHQSLITISKPTPTPTKEPTPTPTPQLVDKSKLSIEVINGTGTPGQAAMVKGLMEGIEYSDIKTSNAEDADQKQTKVVFSKKVDNKKQEEIKGLLLKSFSAVTTSTDSSGSASADITITTGTEK